MDCYILHTFFPVTILPVIIAIICYHYTKNRSKQNRIGPLTIKNWRTIKVIIAFFASIIMLMFAKTKEAKKEFYGGKKQ